MNRGAARAAASRVQGGGLSAQALLRGTIGVVIVALVLLAARSQWGMRAADVTTVVPTLAPRAATPRAVSPSPVGAGTKKHPPPPTTRYLIIGNFFGRHSNQMVSITTGMALANASGRVLVLPDLAFGGKGGGGSVTTPPGNVYSLTPDAIHGDVMCVDKGGCAITAQAFAALFDVHSDTVQMGCITMRGVSVSPKVPAKLPKVACEQSHFVKFKKIRSSVMDGLTALASARVAYIPLVMYMASALEPKTSNAWRLFSPPPEIRLYVAAIRSAEPVCSSTSGGGAWIALHLRNLEGSCANRVTQFWEDEYGAEAVRSSAKELALLKQQCDMNAGYVRGFIESNQLNAATTCVYIADDGQRSEQRVGLKRDLTMPIWWLTRALGEAESDVGKIAKALNGRDVPAISKLLVTSSAGAPSPFFRDGPPGIVPGLTGMLMDFWTLVASDVFLGNQMSTLSVNVCRRRRAEGKPCNNLVTRRNA